MGNTPVPFGNLQPSLAITRVILTSGIFPSGGGGGTATGDTIGFIYDFAGDYAPSGSDQAVGQTLSITQNPALFEVIGTIYGGDGVTTFDLPNLDATAVIGAGAGETEGSATGSSTVTLTPAQVPYPGNTAQPFSNVQPSLPVETLVCVSGVFPSQGGSGGSSAFIGEIANFAGGVVPGGWALADGQTLAISSNTALFSILGTTYGGNGTTTFELPDLQGVVAVGADSTNQVGATFGQAATTLTAAQLPTGGQPVTNDQPSLAIEYLIATAGIFPSQDGSGGSFNSTTPTLGQIVEFAGNFVPSGYALANGQLLQIASNEALFAILGTTYGGNGITTFALPDFRGRTAIGSDGTDAVLGTDYGAATTLLAADNIPACYLAGTLIETSEGDVAVERLAIGDLIRTVGGSLRPIRWIGYRSYGGRFLQANRDLAPIRFPAGCLGEGLPRRDLLVSAKHAMFLAGCLIPAEALADGRWIRADRSFETIEYFHVELDTHDVILAEGAPSETFLDDDSRHIFHNASSFAALHPDVCAGHFYAPRLDNGFLVEEVRALLAKRASLAA